jgi:DNA-binding NtrC family response regulator
MSVPSLLLIGSDASFVDSVRLQIADAFDVHSIAELSQGAAGVRSNPPQVVIADFRAVSDGGHAEVELLDEFASLPCRPLVIVLTGRDCPEPIERQIACTGAILLRAPVTIDDIMQHLPGSSTVEPDGTEGEFVAGQPDASDPRVFDEEDPEFALSGLTRRFETKTARLRMMLSDLEVAARHDVTLLLIGETGAGKTFLARLIHEISPRRNEPFLPIACGALPADLIESEMFGHVKGSFTSAHADKDGKFIAAGQGTILLDEIDVLGPEQQVKLLRVIESGEFEPVGSNRTHKSQARLIVASNVDLQPLVEQKRFRPDLYYRLNMLKFEIPPLRARRPDVVPLAKKFIEEQAAKHRIEISSIDDSLFVSLLNYPWPGNVRELEHVIQRAVIYCRDGVLSARQLPSHVVACQPGPSQDQGPLFDRFADDDFMRGSLGRQVALSEREIIEQTLFQNNQSRTNTAKALGISRVTLYNKMKKYGITK